jgi:hypothetical protein
MERSVLGRSRTVQNPDSVKRSIFDCSSSRKNQFAADVFIHGRILFKVEVNAAALDGACSTSFTVEITPLLVSSRSALDLPKRSRAFFFATDLISTTRSLA